MQVEVRSRVVTEAAITRINALRKSLVLNGLCRSEGAGGRERWGKEHYSRQIRLLALSLAA